MAHTFDIEINPKKTLYAWIFLDLFNSYLLMGLGLPPHVVGLSAIPVTVFFLTLERILIIRLNINYIGPIRRRIFITYLCTLFIGASIVSTAYVMVYPTLTPNAR